MPCVPCKEEICSGRALRDIRSLHSLYTSNIMPKQLRERWIELINRHAEELNIFSHEVMEAP